jgi:hypothetical protein
MLEYSPETGDQILLEFRDTEGTLIHQLDAPGLGNQVLINTQSWQPGLYIVSMRQNGKLVDSVKFTLIN